MAAYLQRHARVPDPTDVGPAARPARGAYPTAGLVRRDGHPRGLAGRAPPTELHPRDHPDARRVLRPAGPDCPGRVSVATETRADASFSPCADDDHDLEADHLPLDRHCGCAAGPGAPLWVGARTQQHAAVHADADVWVADVDHVLCAGTSVGSQDEKCGERDGGGDCGAVCGEHGPAHGAERVYDVLLVLRGRTVM